MQPKCTSSPPCGHTRCVDCKYESVALKLNGYGKGSRTQQKLGGTYTLGDDAALLGPSAEPQQISSMTSESCTTSQDTCPTNAAQIQLRPDTPNTFHLHQAPRQSLNQSDDISISHLANDTQDSLDWSFFGPLALENQEPAGDPIALSGGPRYNDAFVHPPAPRRDELESRLLSFHPSRVEDSDFETSSTSPSTRTPTADRVVLHSSGNDFQKGSQDGGSRSHKRGPKSPRILSKHILPPSQNEEGFACPFWKKDQDRYRACFKVEGYKRIRDVKQHLRRKHLKRPYCLRCGAQFKDEDQLEKHARAVNPCHWDAGVFMEPDGITKSQRDLLAKHSARNGGDAAQWGNIWDIVFPNHKEQKPKSPYVHAGQSEELSSFIGFFQSRCRPYLEKIHEPTFIDRFIEVFNEMHGLWETQRGLSLSKQLAWPGNYVSSTAHINSDTINDAHNFNYWPRLTEFPPSFAPIDDIFMTDMVPEI